MCVLYKELLLILFMYKHIYIYERVSKREEERQMFMAQQLRTERRVFFFSMFILA